ncbi:MAG: hypothetical protein HGA54_01655 [Actinobacteria bacterium]|nr:hypothetical protein [Actinomycetota bacterium]
MARTKKRVCQHCGEPLLPDASKQRVYCSHSCQQAAYKLRKKKAVKPAKKKASTPRKKKVPQTGVKHDRLTPDGIEIAEIYRYFIETFIRHTDREYYDKPFLLDQFQWEDIVLPLVGTLGDDGQRFYEEALIGMRREMGKSEIAAALGLAFMLMEPMPKGEYGIVATDRDQAGIVFDKICSMVALSPKLSSIFEIQTKKLIHRETGATFKTYPAEARAVQGAHFLVVICDEAHEWKNTQLYSGLRSGQGNQKSPLLIIITTAAEHRQGPLWDYIIPRFQKNPRAFIYWVGAQTLEEQQADIPFDPADKKLWEKVCVASWHTMEGIGKLFGSLPLSDFIRYILNIFPPDSLGADMALEPDKVDACLCDGEFDWNRPLSLGIDGAVNGDSFALVFSANAEDGAVESYPVIFTHGTDEGRYDLTQIEELIYEYYMDRDLQRIAVDPARLVMFVQHLKIRYGIPIEDFAQNDKNMCAASGYVYSLIDEGRQRIYGPDRDLLAQHLKNCAKSKSKAYGWRFDKTTNKAKIDGAIAMAMADMTLDQNEPVSMEIVSW